MDPVTNQIPLREFKRVLLWFITVLFLLLINVGANAQSVTEIITNYNGFWKSGVNEIDPVKPDNHHELLSFTYNGTRYSTGVNDSTLTAMSLSFITGHYDALPLLISTGQ